MWSVSGLQPDHVVRLFMSLDSGSLGHSGSWCVICRQGVGVSSAGRELVCHLQAGSWGVICRIINRSVLCSRHGVTSRSMDDNINHLLPNAKSIISDIASLRVACVSRLCLEHSGGVRDDLRSIEMR